MRFYLIFGLISFFALCGFAQEMPINGPDIHQCSGFLVDNGLSAASYTNNQNEIITICAQAPETIVNLYFAVFALGSGDYMKIFNGPSAAAPVIGIYYGTDLQNVDVTSSNPSGCLTVQFVSDATGVGNFGAEISCGPPCVRPVAVITTPDDPAPALICPGEAITFDGSSSVFAPGQTMQSFKWIFDDGTTNTTSWPTVSHTFPGPGGYKVELQITDNNNCSSANLPDYVVYVSTYPDLSLLSPGFDMCAGGTDYLGVNFMIPDSIHSPDSLSTWITVPWNDLPDINLGGALFIPDNQSQCFQSSVTYTNFGLNQTITSVNQIENFFINFEHSYMGDLVISFICPNGKTLTVHQQGGSGTYLGQPVDDESLTPGVGWDYYWSPTATNGTWAQNAGGTLPSGTYASVSPWTNLIGCPLNGTWSVQVCDMWSIDNGYIFDWGINFNPSLFGDLMSFTPIYGQDCDSSYWVGPGIIGQDSGCDFILIEHLQSGSYPYTYYCTNNFGCTFDTTIIVDIFIAPQVNAGQDDIFSCDPITLHGGHDGDPSMSYVWHWSPGTGLSDPNIPNPTLTNLSATTTFTLSGYPVGYEGCLNTDEVVITLDPNTPNPGIETDVSICPEAPPFDMMLALEGNPDGGGSWINPMGVTLANSSFDPATDVSGTYTYTVNFQSCALSAPMHIAVEYPQIAVSADTTVCIGGTASPTAYSASDYHHNYVYTWSTGDTGSSIQFTPAQDTIITVFATDAVGCLSDTVEFYVSLYDSLLVQTFEDTVICPQGDISLQVLNVSGGHGAFHFQWANNAVPIGTGIPFAYSPANEGNICVLVTDACETPQVKDCFNLNYEDAMPFTIDAIPANGCAPLDVDFQLTTDPQLYTSMSWNFFNDKPPVNVPTAENVYPKPGLYDVGVYMVSPRGCAFNHVFQDYIQVFGDPVASWQASPQPTDIYHSEIQFINTSLGSGLSYYWVFNTPHPLGTSTAENPVFTFPNYEGGIYPVSLSIIDANGCSDHIEGIVDINDIFVVYVPNTFTPNQDGINDVFMVYGADIRSTDYELLIFNRWGDLIFKSETPGEPWVGNHRGSDVYVPDGVYTYYLRAASASTTETVKLSGSVLLMR